MVNEVMLASGSGSSGVQFVELLDHGGTEEQFTPVFAPYKLVVYDGAGNQLGEHMLDPTGLRNAAGMDHEYLISTAAADAAFGVTGDEHLDVALPVNAGQVCFQANPSPPAFSCMDYGSVSKPVPTNSQGTGTVRGPVPTNGESDQRQADNSVQSAPPTPKARNRAATGSSPGGGSTPGSSGTGSTPGPSGTRAFGGVSVRSHRARLGRKSEVGVPVSCPASTGRCVGTLDLKSHGGRPRALGHASFTLAPGANIVIRVKLSQGTVRKLRRLGHLVVDATISAHDATGQSKTSVTTIKLVAG
jgi:hypothetical protein